MTAALAQPHCQALFARYRSVYRSLPALLPSRTTSLRSPVPHPAAGDTPGAAAHGARARRDAEHAAWLAAAAAGDSAAFERFYDATAAFARALARRMLRGPQRDADCDDLLADSYFEAWRQLPRFDASRGSAVTWLLQIVRSRSLDLLRRQASQAAEPLEGVEADAPAAGDPAEQLWQLQAGTRLHAALLHLTPPERWVLGLAYFRDLSHSEIAGTTGMPLGTVKSHLQRAQVKLRAALGP
jgi:RNA polymerase sigma-70 factor, ECF subfamily